MLPSLEDDKILFENFKVLFSRILLENVEYFRILSMALLQASCYFVYNLYRFVK